MLLNKKNIEIAKIAGTKSDRLIDTLFVDMKKRQTVATDGHRIAIVSFVENQDGYPSVEGMESSDPKKSFNILANEAVKLLKVIPKNPSWISSCVMLDGIKTDAGDMAHFAVTDSSQCQKLTIKKVEGIFPDYEGVVPKDGPSFRFGINPFYLVELVKLAVTLQDINKHGHIILEFWDNKGPMRIQGISKETGQKFLLLCMSCKID